MEPNLENVSNEIVNASTAPAPTPASAPEKPKSSKGLIATTILFAILAIAGIAGAIYFFMDANNKAVANADLRAKLDLVTTETGAELVEKDENGTTVTVVEVPEGDDSDVKALVKEVYQDLTSKMPTARFETVFADGSIIKISGSDTYTSSNKAYGIVSWGSYYDGAIADDVMQNAHTYVEAFLASKGFIEDSYGYLSQKLFYNSDSQTYCTVSESSFPFSMACSKETWISDEAKSLSLELAEIANFTYVAADPSSITDSQVSPYQTITANGGGGALLFYRTSRDADWQFFKATQAILLCSDYNTEDLKNAYAGQMCYDETTGGNLTVQP